MPSNSSGPPDEPGGSVTQVAGPSKVKRLENCAVQDSSKSSPGIPVTLGLPACRAGVCGEKSVLQCCSVALRAVCRYCEQVP
jgi:hypothetical protein